MKKSKLLLILSAILLLTSIFTGCTGNESSEPSKNQNTGFDTEKDITVVARDAASGTRGAFHELMEIKKDDTDNLVIGALEFDGTDKVITAVEGDSYGIGYISLGSVSERIKAVSVNGIEPTVENVKNGSYVVARPFILATKGTESDLVKDFLAFSASKQVQPIIEDNGFIAVEENPVEYTNSGMSGTIKVAGSTSVTPLMEKLQEAYKEINPDVTFEMQSNGSSQGIKAAIDGSYDIGMSSRELKEEEAAQINRHVLAMDGIATIVNKDNPISDLSSTAITAIYTGEITKWSEVK